MATHPLPPETANLSVNLPSVSKLAVGRLAYARGQYVGEMVRGLLLRELHLALERGEIARDVALEAILSLRKPKALGLAVVCGLSLLGGIPVRRVRIRAARTSMSARVSSWRKQDDGGAAA